MYVYQEYPKSIYSDKNVVIVQDEKEEKLVKSVFCFDVPQGEFELISLEDALLKVEAPVKTAKRSRTLGAAKDPVVENVVEDGDNN